ncbi:MAG: DNA translocase FtsK 4TM domain-containing protein, partial [Rhodobacteraceae bacterium]|nr:DNA translocase FtsK 4TM domain-containing protein [Paracoccaceae bacterium]
MSMAVFSKSKPRRKSRRKKPETKSQALLRKRGAEAMGFAMLVFGAVLFLAFITHTENDPSFFMKTDADAVNLLGRFGSYLSDALHRILGWAFWGIPVFFVVWGARFMMHQGAGRAALRMVFAPIAIFVAATFMAAHAPLDSWGFAYGLGGVFGDSALKFLLGFMPFALGADLKIMTAILAVVFVLISLFALGVSKPEGKAAGHYLLAGLVTIYALSADIFRWLGGVGFRSAKSGMVAAGSGLSAAGKSGLSAAKAASEKRREKKLADNVEKSTNEGRFADRLDTLREENISPKPAVSDPLMARIANAANTEVIDDTPPPEKTEYPALGGVSRKNAPAPDMPAPKPAEPMVKYPSNKPTAKSSRAKAEEQPTLGLEPGLGGYEMPPLSLLESPTKIIRHHLSEDALNANARMLESVLDDYGVKGEIIGVRPGPVVTMYELEPAPGLKASRVIGLADDIARSMSALSARVSTIPGRTVIGIELPNENRETVLLREIFSARAFGDSNHQLPLALGKDIGGEPVVVNLARMPHLLIAGTTGSGKSVAINTMILSLVYALPPEDCRLIMIDPKMLELSVYDGIPHLLSPVVTDPKKAVVALKWAVAEMEERYRKMSKLNVRNIDGFNGRVAEAIAKGEAFTRTVQTGFDDETGDPVFETQEYTLEKLPYIVIIVDEMADLMMVAGKEIEACIQRLAQMARAAGIHLVMATQRPSVDVITGTIKANFPTRISFQVTSKIDSRTVLGEMGAEQLLGKGDMLFMAGGGRITRVHGPFVSDQEVEEIVGFLKAQGEPEYVSSVVEGGGSEADAQLDLKLGLGNGTDENTLLDTAIAIVANDRKCSISYIQRKLSIGYNKAAKLVEEMEDMGIVSPANHVGRREVLV